MDIRLGRGRSRCGESVRRGSDEWSIGSGHNGGGGVVLSVGRYRLGRHDFDHAIGVLFLRIHRFEGEQDLAVEGGKVGFELLQLVLLFPDLSDNLFQDGELFLNGFVVPRVFLYQAGDAVEGVDEVLAGGFRIDRQAAVVIVVEEVAFTSHEETVLAEVQTVLDGGVGLDNDVEAIERADDLRLAVRAFPVLYLVELGGNRFRIIACHAVNLQGVKDSNGITPLALAKETGAKEIENLLLQGMKQQK